MDQRVSAIPSLHYGGGGGNGDGTQHGRLYTYNSDTTRTSSTSTSAHELSEKTWGLKNTPSGEGTINRAFPPPPRAEYNAPELSPRRVVTEKNRWTPLALRARVASALVILMLAIAAAIEVAYAYAWKMNGYSVDILAKYGSPQFFASFLPVLAIVPFALYCLTVNHEVYRLQPYISASHGNAPPQQTVLVSYINQNRLYAVLGALKNGHRMIVVVTLLTSITALWQPLSAALFVVRSTNHILDNSSPIVVTAQLGVNPTFTDLDAFLAAAGYAEAAVVHGLGDPPFVREGWTVTPIEFPQQPKNATIALDAQAVLVDPRCETLTPQLNKITEGSYNITATRGGCVYGFSTNQKDGDDAFGVCQLDNCTADDQTANMEERFKPVVFWFFTFDGPTASMVHCSPLIKTHLVNVNISLSSKLVNTEPVQLHELSSNVTVGEPFNGLALNGLFFPQPLDKFANARSIAVRAALPNAIYKDAATNLRGMASSLRDISTQLNRVKRIYTQYLTIAAKSNFFVPASTTVKPVIETWIPRIWMDKLATHVLASLLIFVALAMAALQHVHRKDRSQLFLAGPPGSIASDVSMTSSAKFGLLLNAGDTEEDLERKLHGMRFGIEHSTGQIIVEREDMNIIAGYVKEEMRRAREGVEYHEDVRASLLSNEKGPGAVHRDSFVGLRSRDGESDEKSGWRVSAVGSIAPSLASHPRSASYAQSTFSPLLSPSRSTAMRSPPHSASSAQTKFSPSRSTAMVSPPPVGPITFTTSPPSSSTATNFPTTRFSAPAGPPPQPQDRSSYFDPYAPPPA